MSEAPAEFKALMAKMAFHESLFGPEDARKWDRSLAGTDYVMRVVLAESNAKNAAQPTLSLQLVYTETGASAALGGVSVMSQRISFTDTSSMIEKTRDKIKLYWAYSKDDRNYCPACKALMIIQTVQEVAQRRCHKCGYSTAPNPPADIGG